MQSRAAAFLTAALLALLACPAGAGAAQLVKVEGTFTTPTYVAAPPGDPHRLFVVEKDGRIQLLHDGVQSEFLDMHADIVTNGEQGLLSMAFAPDYATSGRFYVYYTAPRADTSDTTGSALTIAELQRSATDPDVADPARRTLFTVDHPTNGNHNGGQLQVGPDGLLYVGTGDGGSGNDPPDNAQNPGVLLGKLLRIDPRAVGAAPELYASGLRNPWRFSFDRQTGELVIADVGQSQREEVDLAARAAAPGANYGWRCREGFIANPSIAPACNPPGAADPVFDYDHAGGRCAITGGYVVRNHDLDSLFGRYLYADLCVGEIHSMALAQPVTDETNTGLPAHGGVYSFGEDSCGHVYVTHGDGEVDVLVDNALTPCPEPPVKPPPVEKPPEEKPPPVKPPSKDTRRPGLLVFRERAQSLTPHRSLYARVACDERCAVTASATLTVPGAAGVLDVAGVSRSLVPGTQVRLRLLLTRSSATIARRALRRGERVRARLKVVARDAAGNQTVKYKSVRVLL